LTSFSDLGLAEPLLRALDHEGYSETTPIQSAAIGPLLEKRDLVGIAQTGTGKTAAFLLPLLHEMAARGPRKRALILSPTRELGAQIEEASRRYARFLQISSTLVIGGASARLQLRALKGGPDILVATPGRLLDYMTNAILDLGAFSTLVLDEADQMLDKGFLPTVRQILKALPRIRQTVLFSATMPKQIRALADEFMQDPVEVAVATVAAPIERIEQRVVAVPASQKCQTLTVLLRETGVERAIVFTRTKRSADRLSRHLAGERLSAMASHGDKTQDQRERTLVAFKEGRLRTLVATDIAARGINIEGVSHVFNYELPNVPETYVHRIGRTARAGASGEAVSLVDPAEYGMLGAIEGLIGRTLLPRPQAPKKAKLPRRRKLSGQPIRSAGRSKQHATAEDGNAPLKRRRPRRRQLQKSRQSAQHAAA